MPRETVLIAAFSGRALAASARRAGYRPLVVDSFGDEDTRALAEGRVRVLEKAFKRGFRHDHLVEALDALSAGAEAAPVGLLLGAGFEDKPGVVARLAERYTLIGCPADSIRAAKDPARFFTLLSELGIPHPETRTTPPADGRGWLTKRIGGSGGTHIARCRAKVSPQRQRYFQREVQGTPLSMLGITGRTSAFAFSTSWLDPMPRRPYRFGGMAGPVDVDADLEARLIDIGLDLIRALGLVGLVSFDFLVVDDGPLLLEVNPRPGASLDILDDAQGTLFKAHIAAARGGDPAGVVMRDWKPATRAAAYLYAAETPLTVPAFDWPDWTSDRPAPGTTIGPQQPVCSVHAEGASLDAATLMLSQRLDRLKSMLYGQKKNTGKETS